MRTARRVLRLLRLGRTGRRSLQLFVVVPIELIRFIRQVLKVGRRDLDHTELTIGLPDRLRNTLGEFVFGLTSA